MTRATGDCHVCGAEETDIHLLATCDRCRAAAGRFSQLPHPAGKRGRRSGSTSYQETFCCSFCGRAPKEARKMFSGPWTFICDGCVALAADAMRADLGADWAPSLDDPPPREAHPSVGPARESTREPSSGGHPGRKTLSGHATSSERREITGVGPAPTGPGRRTPRPR